ncbi:MAG: trigger factor family protein [Chitinophagaceae bacterium]|nr:trigger factor family protein [Chitinophagaceae bacterium]
MEYTIKKNSPVEFDITITLSPEDYVKNVEESIKKYINAHPPKGFRPGKIPFDLAKKKVGVEFIEHSIYNIIEDIIEKKSTEIDTFCQENKCLLNDTIKRIFRKEEIIEPYNAKKPITISCVYPLYDKETPISFENISLRIAKIRTTDVEVSTIQNILMNKFSRRIENITESTDTDAENKEDKHNLQNKTKNFHTILSIATKDGAVIIEKNNTYSLNITPHMREQILTHTSSAFPFHIEIDIQSIFLNPIVTKELIFEYHKIQKTIAQSEEHISVIVNVQDIIYIDVPELDQTFFDNCFGKDTVKSKKEFLKKCEEMHKKYAEQRCVNKYISLFMEKLYERNKNILVNTTCYLYSKNHITEKTLNEKEKKEFEEFIKDSITETLCIRILDSINIPITQEYLLEEFLFDYLIKYRHPFLQSYDSMKKIYRTYFFESQNHQENDKGEETRKQQLLTEQYNSIMHNQIFQYITQKIQLEIEEVDAVDFQK